MQVPGDGLYLGGCNFMDSGMGLSLAGGSTLVTQSYFARNNVSLRLRGAGHVVRHSDFNVDNWSVIVAANQSRFEDNSYANAAVAALLVIGDENWFGNETLTGGARGVRQDAGSGNHYYRLAAGGYTIAAFDLTGGAAQLIDSDLNDNSGIGLNVTDATIRGRDTYLLRNHIGISFTGAGNGSELRGFNASASTGTGLTASHTTDFTVRDSWFTHNGGDGVEVGVNASLRLDGCGIHANGRHGVHLNGSLRVVVNGTLSTGHSGYGFLFEDDRLTQLMASRARGNAWGLLLNRSTAATLRDNEIAYNGYQVGLEGLVRDHFFHTMDTSNSVGGKQLLYLVNLTRVEYEATFEPGFMTVVNSLDSRFTGYRVSGDRQGVVAAFNENCTFAEFNITGNYQGVRLTGGENNNVTGGWFEANELGLLAESESHFTLDDNRFHDNLNGTLLSGSSHALLDDNFWSAQVFDGLELRDSPAAVLRDNHLDGAGRYGLRLHRSSNATLENNTITDNRYNVGVWGDPYGDFVSYFAATQVNGLPAVLLIAPRNTTYNASLNPGFVAVVGGWNVTITGLDMAANGQGLLLAYTNRSRVENVIVRDNLYGIHLYRSHNNTLVNITATGNYRGIIIERSIDNLLLDCQVVDNEEGVVLLAAGGNRLEALNGTHNSIGVLIEGYSAVRETELFNDTFAAASLGGDWAAADGVTLNTGHNHGDSYGLEFRGNASATSHNIDIAGCEGMYLAFDFQPGGSHDPPEAEDWLQLEYRQANGSWAQLWQRYGDSARWPYYGYEFIELPFPALHATFAFRFQSRGEAGADSFYIDNVRLAQPQVRGNLLLNTSLTNGGEGVVLDDARHNTLRNLTLTRHTAAALDLTGASRYNLIESSNLNFNRDGASFGSYGSYNTLRRSHLDHNLRDGLFLAGNYHQVHHNYLLDNQRYGIFVGEGTGSHIYANVINGSGVYGIYIEDVASNQQDLSWNNSVDGSPLRYYYNIHGTAAGPYVVGAINWTLYDRAINTGLVIRSCSYMVFMENTLANQNRGIYLSGSNHITLQRVLLYDNTADSDPGGLYLSGSSYITLTDFTFAGNGYGATIGGSHVTLRNGTFRDHVGTALYLWYGNNFIAENLTFEHNRGRELDIRGSGARFEDITVTDGSYWQAARLRGSGTWFANATFVSSGEVTISGSGERLYRVTLTGSGVAVNGSGSRLTEIEVSGAGTALELAGSDSRLDDVTLRDSNTGLLLDEAQPQLNGLILLRNDAGAYVTPGSLLDGVTIIDNDVGALLNGSAEVRNGQFTNNDVGLRTTAGGGSVRDSRFTASPLELIHDGVTLRDNDLTGTSVTITGNGTMMDGGDLVESIIYDYGNGTSFTGITISGTSDYALLGEGSGGIITGCTFNDNAGGIRLAQWSHDTAVQSNIFNNNGGNAVWLGGEDNLVEGNTGNGNWIGLYVPLHGNNTARDNDWDAPARYGVFIAEPLLNNQSIALSNRINGDELPLFIDFQGVPGVGARPAEPYVITGYDYTANPRIVNFGLVVRGGGWLRIHNVTVTDRPWGLWLDAHDVEIADSTFIGNGVGMRLNGSAIHVHDTTVTDSAGTGLNLTGSDMLIERVNASDGAGHGIWIGGNRVTLRDSLCADNSGYGLYAPAIGDHHYWSNTLRGNGLDLFFVEPYTTVEDLALNNTVGGHLVPWVVDRSAPYVITNLDYDLQPHLTNFGIVLRNAGAVEVRNAVIANRPHGIYTRDSGVVFENLTLHDNGVAIEAWNVSGRLGNATVADNGYGVRVHSGELALWNGHFRDNGLAFSHYAGASGNWFVSNPHTASLTNDTIRLRGSLVVTSANGNLTLAHAQLYLVADDNGTVGITIAGGGVLRVGEWNATPGTGSLVACGGSGALFFIAEPGATLSIRNSTIEGVGYHNGPAEHAAMQIATGDALVAGSVIDGSYGGLNISGHGGHFIDNTFPGHGQTAPAVLLYRVADVTLDGNYISDRAAPAVQLDHVGWNRLLNNEFTACILGLEVINASEGTLLESNRYLNNQQGLFIEDGRLTAHNETHLDNDLDITLREADVYLLNTTFTTLSIDSASQFEVANYLVVAVTHFTGRGVCNVQVHIVDNNRTLYATPAYNGTDLVTPASGRTPLVAVTDRIYYGSPVAVENRTFIEVQYYLWNASREVNMSLSHTETFVRPGLVIIVDDDGPADYHTIGEAAEAALDGDTILVRNGTYTEAVMLEWAVTVRGEGQTIVRAPGNAPFTLNITHVTLDRLTLRDSLTAVIALNGSHARLANLTFIDNTLDIFVSNRSHNVVTLNATGQVLVNGSLEERNFLTFAVNNIDYRWQPLHGVEWRLRDDNSTVIATPLFGGDAPVSDRRGRITWLEAIYRYHYNQTLTWNETWLTVNYSTGNETRLVNMSTSHIEYFAFDTERPRIQSVDTAAGVNRTHTLELWVNASDREDWPWLLTPQLEARFDSGNWSADWSGVANYTNATGWRLRWTPPANATLGNWTLRLRFTDPDWDNATWYNLTVEVRNNRPEATELTTSGSWINRTFALNLSGLGFDVENNRAQLIPEFWYRAPGANWSSEWFGNSSFDGLHWNVTWTPPADAPLGNYTTRFRLSDVDGDFGYWQAGPLMNVRNNLPWAATIVVAGSHVYRTNITVLTTFGNDIEDPSWSLRSAFMYLAPGGEWSTTYITKPYYNHTSHRWETNFTPPANATLGPYRFRVMLTDLDNGTSDWLNATGRLWVRNNDPVVTSIDFTDDNVARMRFTTLFGNATDIEDNIANLTPEFEALAPTAGNYSGDFFTVMQYDNGIWKVFFQPPPEAELGMYRFRGRFRDTDGNASRWQLLPSRLEVVNFIPELRLFEPSVTALERMTSFTINFSAIDENPPELNLILRYWPPGGEWEQAYLSGGIYNNSLTITEAGERYSTWQYIFTPTADAILGNYSFIYWLEDELGGQDGPGFISQKIEVRNYLPRTINFTFGDRFLERLEATLIHITPHDESTSNLTLEIQHRPNDTLEWRMNYFSEAEYFSEPDEYRLLLKIPLASQRGFHDLRLRFRDELNDWGPWFYRSNAFRVLNSPPHINPIANISVLSGEPTIFTVIAIDWDGHVVLYQWDFDGDDVVDYASNSSANLTYLYPRSGTFFAHLIVWDNEGNFTRKTVVVKILHEYQEAKVRPMSRTDLIMLLLGVLAVFGGPLYLVRVSRIKKHRRRSVTDDETSQKVAPDKIKHEIEAFLGKGGMFDVQTDDIKTTLEEMDEMPQFPSDDEEHDK